MLNFSAFSALTMDCYGTLIDWESGIADVLLGWAASQGFNAGAEELLTAYAVAEADCEREYPALAYRDLLKQVHHRLAKHFEVDSDPQAADQLAHSVGLWPAFDDTTGALTRLQSRFKLAIVSNVDQQSFAGTAVRLEIDFDAVITAEEVGAYKPDVRMFLRAFEVLEDLGISRHEVLHVAQSLYHDHVPAKQLGMRTVWVDRRCGRPGGATPAPNVVVEPDLTVRSLAQLADIVDAAS
ncbi:MAG: HAD-IA family hydrolase [Gemmatimonadetes bacterium]|nr:HAD-IA family hydrolase [Gemmatimonadota bacterium]